MNLSLLSTCWLGPFLPPLLPSHHDHHSFHRHHHHDRHVLHHHGDHHRVYWNVRSKPILFYQEQSPMPRQAGAPKVQLVHHLLHAQNFCVTTIATSAWPATCYVTTFGRKNQLLLLPPKIVSRPCGVNHCFVCRSRFCRGTLKPTFH